MNQVKSLEVRPAGTDSCASYHIQPTQIEDDAWEKVYGMDAFKAKLMDTYVQPMLYPHLFDAKSVKNILLYGPPGTGKTFVARAIARRIQQELVGAHQPQQVLFFIPQKNDLNSKYASESGQKITCMFQRAEQNRPDLNMIFVDEIDDLVKDRSESHPGSVTNSDSVTAFLQVLDGAISYPHVYFVAATNYPWKLDAAFLSRVKPIPMDVPSATGIHQIVLQTIYDVVKPHCDDLSVSDVDYTRQLVLWAAQFVEVILPRPTLLHEVEMELCRKDYQKDEIYHQEIMGYILKNREFSQGGWSSTGLSIRTIRTLIGDWKSWNGLQVVRQTRSGLTRETPLHLENMQEPRLFFADPQACPRFTYPALDLAGYVDIIEYSVTNNRPRERNVVRQKCKPATGQEHHYRLYPFLNIQYVAQGPEMFYQHETLTIHSQPHVRFTGVGGNTLTVPLLEVPM